MLINLVSNELGEVNMERNDSRNPKNPQNPQANREWDKSEPGRGGQSHDKQKDAGLGKDKGKEPGQQRPGQGQGQQKDKHR
jgi:hypothetical protein